jgi:hypothetical protein
MTSWHFGSVVNAQVLISMCPRHRSQSADSDEANLTYLILLQGHSHPGGVAAFPGRIAPKTLAPTFLGVPDPEHALVGV